MFKNIEVLLDNLSISATKYEIEMSDEDKLLFAQYFCFNMIKRYWEYRICDENYKIDEYSFDKKLKIKEKPLEIAEQLALILFEQTNEKAGYYIGNIYTSLLPEKYRAEKGAYYTPPILVKRMLYNLDCYGIDWEKNTILDPSCGGAAFLTIITRFIINKFNKIKSGKEILEIIENNIFGYEIDPFAAWISQVLLEIEVYDIYLETQIRLNKRILVKDSLKLDYKRKFDIVIGNPPYGKLKLNSDLRNKFKDTIYGHPNMYGLFTEIAVNITKKNGFIAFVTPTSFLGGNYFKKLREYLSENAPLVSIDFIKDREGVFKDVLQETALTIYKRADSNRDVVVSEIITDKYLDEIDVNDLGSFKIDIDSDKPWIIPRDKEKISIYKNLNNKNRTLTNYGYKIKTGQLVWNRYKSQISYSPEGAFPLIWAESILRNGSFEFKYSKRNHAPYFKVESGQDFLLTKRECIIVQRTTSKEQSKRIIAAVLPQEFIDEYGGVVVENHINVIEKTNESILDLNTLCFLLNSLTVDHIFRCINGSVAVSAYEMNSIPLPQENEIQSLKDFILVNNNISKIEEHILNIYGDFNFGNNTISTEYLRKIG